MPKLARTTIALLAGLVLLAGCGTSIGADDTGAAAETVETTVTPDPMSRAPYAAEGPYDVGFTVLHQADGRQVVVWYPAARGDHPAAAQEVLDEFAVLRPDLRAKVPASERSTYPVDAWDGAAPAHLADPAPLVLYSHPYSGMPDTSVSLTTHLASWGFVVAAPEHVERSLAGLYGTSAEGVAPRTDGDVLGASIDLLAQASRASGPLHGLVDVDRTSVIGFSAGAGSAYGFASDPRIDGFIAYGVGFGGQLGPRPATPHKPGMVVLADRDRGVPPMLSKKVYAAMDDPKYLVRVYDAGHEVFGDTCLVGGDAHPIVEVVRAHHVLPDWLTDLAGDGCQEDLPPVSEAQPGIDQATVAFLRWVAGVDPEPLGLSTRAVGRLGVPVTVTRN